MASNSYQQQTSSSSSTGFSGIDNPEALATLMSLISQLSSGGTDAMKAQATDKKAGIDLTKATLQDFTKGKAFTDALALMQSSLDKAMEAQKPAIQRAVEGAGTSASSMQALLSQKASSDAATQAGALGAEQAKAYGAITAQLLSTLNTSASQMDPAVQALIQALDLTKVSKQSSTSTSQGTSSSVTTPDNPGGGGSTGGGSYSGGGGGGYSGGGAQLMDLNDLMKLAGSTPVSTGSTQYSGYSTPTIGKDGTITWSNPYATSGQWSSTGGGNNDAGVWDGLILSNQSADQYWQDYGSVYDNPYAGSASSSNDFSFESDFYL